MHQQGIGKSVLVYAVKFILFFCILYFGTIAVIGLASNEGEYYSRLIDHFFNYPGWSKDSLLHGTNAFVSIFGYDTFIVLPSKIAIHHSGSAINIGYDYLGYGVLSFWIAFVFANKGTFLIKILWMLGGMILIWCINILRMSLLLMAVNNNWRIPLFDQHTWFIIAAYILIFVLIYFYEWSGSGPIVRSNTPKDS